MMFLVEHDHRPSAPVTLVVTIVVNNSTVVNNSKVIIPAIHEAPDLYQAPSFVILIQ